MVKFFCTFVVLSHILVILFLFKIFEQHKKMKPIVIFFYIIFVLMHKFTKQTNGRAMV